MHLICIEKGEFLSFYLTKGNIDDQNPKHIKKMTEHLFGKFFSMLFGKCFSLMESSFSPNLESI